MLLLIIDHIYTRAYEIADARQCSHTLVDVKFGPQLNFLVGHNGSGKSAILSGIMMALGAAGRATGRAKANKSFVKDGSQ